MIDTCIRNELKFRFVLMDSWFSATENFEFIAGKGRHFIAALKDNRLIAVTEEDRKQQAFSAGRRAGHSRANRQCAAGSRAMRKKSLWLRQVFTNKDGSTGRLHLVCSDLTCELRRHRHDLQKTVASGGVSQILEVQRQPGKVAHANTENPKQPCFSVDLRGLQAGMPEPQEKAQPLRPVSQAAHQRVAVSLRRTASTSGGCVTSVTRFQSPN
jgi:hypothetical protein